MSDGSRGRVVLAIDLGTTALKLALATTRGRLLDTEAEPQRVAVLPGGGAEQDPKDWRASIVRASRRLLGRNTELAGRIEAVNASVQWSGTVAIGEDGRPQRPAMIWMDSRGAGEARRITGGFPKVQGDGGRRMVRWIRLTGGAPTHSGKDPIAHILWLRQAGPEKYARAAVFLEPKDWLNLRLTGRAIYDRLYPEFVNLYRRTKPIYARLNRGRES